MNPFGLLASNRPAHAPRPRLAMPTDDQLSQLIPGDPDPTWDSRGPASPQTGHPRPWGHPKITCMAEHPEGWCCTREPHTTGPHVAGAGPVSYSRDAGQLVGGVQAVWSTS